MSRVVAAEYPRARFDRTQTGDSGLSSQAGFSIPTVRIWTFQLRQGANKRATVASPPLHGPAVIRELLLNPDFGAAGGVMPLIQLFKSPSPGPVGNTLALSATPNGVNIFDSSISLDGQFIDPGQPGSFYAAVAATKPTRITPLNIVVQESLFYLNLSLRNDLAGAIVVEGSVRVYERIDPQILASLIAS